MWATTTPPLPGYLTPLIHPLCSPLTLFLLLPPQNVPYLCSPPVASSLAYPHTPEGSRLGSPGENPGTPFLSLKGIQLKYNACRHTQTMYPVNIEPTTSSTNSWLRTKGTKEFNMPNHNPWELCACPTNQYYTIPISPPFI